MYTVLVHMFILWTWLKRDLNFNAFADIEIALWMCDQNNVLHAAQPKNRAFFGSVATF